MQKTQDIGAVYKAPRIGGPVDDDEQFEVLEVLFDDVANRLIDESLAIEDRDENA